MIGRFSIMSFTLLIFVWFPTISAQVVTLDLEMPGCTFVPGSLCSLDLNMRNTGPDYPGAHIFVALNVGTDDYWFYPGWTQYPGGLDWETMDNETLSESTIPILTVFTWPWSAGEHLNSSFFSAAVSPSGELISNVDMFPFGWMMSPRLDTLSPASGSPGKLLKLSGKGLNLPVPDIRIHIGDMYLPVISRGVDDTSETFLVSVIPYREPGNYEVMVEGNGLVTGGLNLQIREPAASGETPGQVMSDISGGMAALVMTMRDNILPDAVDAGMIEDVSKYESALSRAEEISGAFYEASLNMGQVNREYLESVLSENGVADIFADLAAVMQEYRTRGSMEVAGSNLMLTLDVTSACLSALDTVWTASDIATMAAAFMSDGTALSSPVVSTGFHLFIKLIEQVIDSGFSTDLADVYFYGIQPESIISLSPLEPGEFTVTGTFESQETIVDATVGSIVDACLAETGDWFPETLKNELKIHILNILSDSDLEEWMSFMGDEFISIGSIPACDLPLDFEYFTDPVDLSSMIDRSLFHAGTVPMAELMTVLGDYVCDSGIETSCDTCLIWEIDYEILRLTATGSGHAALDGLFLNWFAYDTLRQEMLNLEIPHSKGPVIYKIRVGDSPDPTPTPNAVPCGFVYLDPGAFTMGSPFTEDCRYAGETQHQVTLTRGFYMMQTEVTRRMWADLNVVQPTLPGDPSNTEYSPTLDHPVQRLTWYEAILFANLMSVHHGMTRCYYRDEDYTTAVDATNYTTDPVFCNFDANGFRLPTESEWEYACRAGTTGPFSCSEPEYDSGNCGSCSEGTHPTLEQYCLYCANDPGLTAEAGSRQPNPADLYDMHGNVWEWCWDWYETYPDGTVTDPTGPLTGVNRVRRGGSRRSYAQYCRSASRGNYTPNFKIGGLGFRLVMTADSQTSR